MRIQRTPKVGTKRPQKQRGFEESKKGISEKGKERFLGWKKGAFGVHTCHASGETLLHSCLESIGAHPVPQLGGTPGWGGWGDGVALFGGHQHRLAFHPSHVPGVGASQPAGNGPKREEFSPKLGLGEEGEGKWAPKWEEMGSKWEEMGPKWEEMGPKLGLGVGKKWKGGVGEKEEKGERKKGEKRRGVGPKMGRNGPKREELSPESGLGGLGGEWAQTGSNSPQSGAQFYPKTSALPVLTSGKRAQPQNPPF